MDRSLSVQYQVIAQPPAQSAQPGQSNAAPWIYPWSLPVRVKINKQLAIALIASGLFAPVSPPEPGPGYESQWHYGWSEPVRFKPAVLTANQQFFFYGNQKPEVSFSYYNWLTEPVRFKPGLGAQLQQSFTIDAQIPPNVNTTLQGYNWWSEPVRLPIGLKTWLQQTLAMPPRVLPTPTITATLLATETNTDVAVFAINVYESVTPATSGQGARVSIVEISADSGDPVSVRES